MRSSDAPKVTQLEGDPAIQRRCEDACKASCRNLSAVDQEWSDRVLGASRPSWPATSCDRVTLRPGQPYQHLLKMPNSNFQYTNSQTMTSI